MALAKIQKQKILEDLKEKIAKQKAIIFIDFTGLKVKEFSILRRKLRAEDCQVKVAKKTLMGIALKEAKIEVDAKNLAGEMALVFGYKEPITPAKIVYQFSQENPNLRILAGFFENKFREIGEVIALAKLPSREELLAKLVGSLSAPISNFRNVLEANIKGLIFILTKIKT